MHLQEWNRVLSTTGQMRPPSKTRQQSSMLSSTTLVAATAQMLWHVLSLLQPIEYSSLRSLTRCTLGRRVWMVLIWYGTPFVRTDRGLNVQCDWCVKDICTLESIPAHGSPMQSLYSLHIVVLCHLYPHKLHIPMQISCLMHAVGFDRWVHLTPNVCPHTRIRSSTLTHFHHPGPHAHHSAADYHTSIHAFTRNRCSTTLAMGTPYTPQRPLHCVCHSLGGTRTYSRPKRFDCTCANSGWLRGRRYKSGIQQLPSHRVR